MREMKSRVVNAGAKLRLNGEVWSAVTVEEEEEEEEETDNEEVDLSGI